MLERLRMQEVKEIIFSVPEGVVIEGTTFKAGEPVMIIQNPGVSQLLFSDIKKKNEDKSFLSTSGHTKSLDFTINEGAILYSVWSYLHGTSSTHTNTVLRGTEWLEAVDGRLELSTTPRTLIVFEKTEEQLKRISDYHVVQENEQYYVVLDNPTNNYYFVSYTYEVQDVQITTVKQIHNNIFCTMDIYFEGVDMETDDKYDICVHCDRVQIFSDLAIGINDSAKASFTPIEVHSIPQYNNNGHINKNIADIVVIKRG